MANETSYSWDGASTSTISSNEYGRINFDSTVDKVETLENGDLVISKGENSLTVTGYYDEETKKIKNDSAELNLNYPTDSVNRLTLDLNNNTITNSYGDTHESLPIADLDITSISCLLYNLPFFIYFSFRSCFIDKNSLKYIYKIDLLFQLLYNNCRKVLIFLLN